MKPIDIPPDGRFKKEYLLVDGTPCEFEIAVPGTSSALLYDIAKKDDETIESKFGSIPSLNFLFALKDSHKYLKNSPHVFKTLRDWHVLRSMGAKIPDEWSDAFKKRRKETYNYSHPKLNVKKDDFFKGDQVEYVYDHDSIHRAVAILDRPAYTYYQKDGAEVECSKEKFFGLPEIYRVCGVVEESCVLAIERSLVPHPGKLSPKQAWLLAYSKVITSITSGWFRQWGYENFPLIMKAYPENYFEKFKEGVSNGTVLPYDAKADGNPYK